MNTSRISNLPFRAYQYRIDSHADQDQKSLEAQCKQGQHYIAGQCLDHGKNSRFKVGWFGADLLRDAAHLRVDIIKKAAEIGHNRRYQQRLDPIRNRFENCFHSEPPPIRKNG